MSGKNACACGSAPKLIFACSGAADVGAVAVVVAALLSAWKYGPYLDPIVSILVVALVLLSGWRLLRDATRVLLERTPDGINLQELRQDVQQLVPGGDLHHVHVWELRQNQRFLTAHLRVADRLLSNLETVLRQVRGRLQTRWAISHATLEPEIVGCGDAALLGTPPSSDSSHLSEIERRDS